MTYKVYVDYKDPSYANKSFVAKEVSPSNNRTLVLNFNDKKGIVIPMENIQYYTVEIIEN